MSGKALELVGLDTVGELILFEKVILPLVKLLSSFQSEA